VKKTHTHTSKLQLISDAQIHREHQPQNFIDGTPENLTLSTLVFEALMWLKNGIKECVHCLFVCPNRCLTANNYLIWWFL
jgi:hypothetical protein